jgi:hypothetical protein
MEKIITNLWILFSLYMLVFAAMMADLWSGVRKAKHLGLARTSFGLRRTVDKIARYYNMLIALSIVDLMQGTAVWYLDTYYDCNIPLFPFVTLLGAIGLVFIEIKSIYENANKNSQAKINDTLALTHSVLADKGNINEIIKDFLEYLKGKKEVKNESK